MWNQPDKVQTFGRERAQLEQSVGVCDEISVGLQELAAVLEFLEQGEDAAWETEWQTLHARMEATLAKLEFQRMFSGKMDTHAAFLEIQSGSGGTEAQDWAEMLLRMYLRWGDHHGFKMTLQEVSPGDVAGIKGATVHVEGEYAYGWLRTEIGVHRLVRKSPFDSGNRRHTSFASVFVSPEVDEEIEIDINPVDLRVDTYRASGAGGQHVNRTDSAVRITHGPSGIVVQCQSERSQHQNRAYAMKQLRAKLYELEERKQQAERAASEAQKLDITWGSQIRSYILDDARVKDLRTGVETRNTQAVLDGDIDLFLEASLKKLQSDG
ncbi:MAG: peptide chain release factor 2 [Gammaproteobacteria bacterium RIFCSPHIGHO2_12_FULL_45_9]|nr:MAG: peptide chain release factor 2 [Gammaproteobacteria bacterium RIFCSPHIGHO2_12_FULL_45_9]